MKAGAVARVKSGPISIAIYHLASKDTYEAKWKEDGRERRLKNKDLDELKRRLRKQARRLAGNSPAVETLTDDEKAILQEIRRRRITLADLATIHTAEPVTVDDAITQFLEDKRDTSADNQLTLRTHLRQFAKTFGKRNINTVTTQELDGWLRKIAPGLRTKKNKRGCLVSLWRWARDKGQLPLHDRTAAERTSMPSERRQKRERVVETWAAEELEQILKVVPHTHLPWVILASFAGIRTRELFENKRSIAPSKEVLQWEHITLTGAEPRIVVPASVAKVPSKRTIPISPQLAKWLRPYKGRTGPICPGLVPWNAPRKTAAIPNPQSVNQIIADAVGVPFKKNGLRHSFGTYRTLMVGHVGPVALEMGNSEAKVKENYFDAGKTKQEAKDWFAITPAKVSRKLEVVA